MNKNSVQTLYALGKAKWYDPFKRVWNKMVSSRAEKDLINFLRENLDETKNILDLGCGTAMNLETIFSLNLKFKKYLGLDFSPDMLQIAQKKFFNISNIKFREKDITNLDDVDEKFDIIICTWVLSHLVSPSDLVNCAQKLLGLNGKMFLIFFTKPKWYINFWFFPFARYLFRTHYVLEKSIKNFKNIQAIHRYSANITTVAQIQV